MSVSPQLDTQCPVLVVDDFHVMRKIICSQLETLGFKKVDTAKDGMEALRLLSERRYGLVISDWNMAPMSGAELVRAIRSNQALADTKFLMITAESRTETLVAAREAGINSHLLKPFDSRMLGNKIAVACAAA